MILKLSLICLNFNEIKSKEIQNTTTFDDILLYNLLQCIATSFNKAPSGSVKYIMKDCHLQNNKLFIYLRCLINKLGVTRIKLNNIK